MSLPALYVLTNEYRAAADKLADMDMPPEVVADTLESISGDLEVKAQAVACMARNFESVADAIKEHREAQKKREDAYRNRAAGLLDYLARCLDAAGIEKVEGPGIAIGWRKSSAVIVNEPGLLPAEFMRQPETPPPAPDKKAIADAIKAGRAVPGAHIEQRRNLAIR
jgi:hypothetical protein